MVQRDANFLRPFDLTKSVGADPSVLPFGHTEPPETMRVLASATSGSEVQKIKIVNSSDFISGASDRRQSATENS